MKAQDCSDFYKKYCISYKLEGFKFLPESRSLSLEKGDSAEFIIDLYNAMDYHINIAIDDVFGQKLVVKLIDIDNNVTVYDNKNDSMNLNIDISIKKQIRTLVKINTIKPRQLSPNKIKGCVGILIENKPTLKTGF